MLYIIKSALLLTILYGSFALLLSRETFHRFNRLALLSVLVASMALPAIELNIQKPSFLCYEETAFPSPSVLLDSQSDSKAYEHLKSETNNGIANPIVHNAWNANPTEQETNHRQFSFSVHPTNA